MLRAGNGGFGEYESGIVVDLEISTYQVPRRGNFFLLLLFPNCCFLLLSFLFFLFFLRSDTIRALRPTIYVWDVTAVTTWHCS